MEFGFYPKQCDLTVGDVQISTLPDLELKRNRVLQCEWTRDHWTYAPLALATDIFSEQTTEIPYSARVFGLPKTHHLQHARPQGFDHCQFLMWCFAFFVGMRMTETEAGFLDATPVKPGSLCDFLISRTSLEKAVAASDSFYTATFPTLKSQEVGSLQFMPYSCHRILCFLNMSASCIFIYIDGCSFLCAQLDARSEPTWRKARSPHRGVMPNLWHHNASVG